MDKEELFNLVKMSLWGNGTAIVDRDLYEEMKQQAIAVLPAPCLSSLGLPAELEKEWKNYIFRQLSYNIQSSYAQSELAISVPYVVLKGTSVAKYYPHPEYRVMGDIDLMTRREDFEIAYQQLIDNGYRAIKELNREVTLEKNGIILEIHRRFATLTNPTQVKYLDDLIINNITPSHILPDLINGLVIIEHINQHMEGGLGLRQIIDWMMFVDKCLPDEKWSEFSELVQKIGLEKLAIACTRICEMYLGLPYREWCANADIDLCKQLMDYVLSCGNFGNKRTSDENISENVIAYASTPKMLFKLLQRQGLANWNAAKKHCFFKPFAWIYQLFRYASRGIKRDQAVSKLKAEYSNAKKRNKLFDELGIKTVAKGVVVLKDGEYVKE